MDLQSGASAFRVIAPVPAPVQQPLEEARTASGFVPCKCRNSKCLKRYCVCFERGEACAAECRCVGCGNIDGTEARRNALQQKKRKKVAGAGCTCTRSRCLKRYCDCFAAGETCSPQCRCLDCGNLGPGQHPMPPPPVRPGDGLAPLARPGASGPARAPPAPVPIAPAPRFLFQQRVPQALSYGGALPQFLPDVVPQIPLARPRSDFVFRVVMHRWGFEAAAGKNILRHL